MAQVEAVTDADFKNKVLNASKPVLVDFWASWCGPCKAIAPIVEELASQHGEKMAFYKLNIDENADTTTTYKIKGIPTLLLFKQGKLVDQVVGAVPKANLEALISKAI